MDKPFESHFCSYESYGRALEEYSDKLNTQFVAAQDEIEHLERVNTEWRDTTYKLRTELEQLRHRVKELEYEESKSSDMAHKNLQLWMEVSEKLGESEQRVSELEEQAAENNHHLQVEVESCNHFMEQLAAIQLDNLRLRSALESIANNTCCGNCQEAKLVAQEALSTPTDTEALEKYLADRFEQISYEAPINGNHIAQARILLAAQQLKEKP